jgi:hypothetical protein
VSGHLLLQLNTLLLRVVVGEQMAITLVVVVLVAFAQMLSVKLLVVELLLKLLLLA